MKRITPEEVLKAYEKTGLKPMRGDYYPFQGCACALGVMAVTLKLSGNLYDHFQDIYGDYQDAFTDGFDGRRKPTGGLCKTDEIAYKDGNAAWEAVKHLAEVKA
jgi:hypothetical protein